MRQLMHKSFFDRNTKVGVRRYLSRIGFSEPYEFIQANPGFVYAVCGDDLPEEGAETEYLPDYDKGLIDTSLKLEVAILLMDAGFSTVKSVRDATDETLLAIDGITADRLRKIRTLESTS
mgnify:CR=1 FL=1